MNKYLNFKRKPNQEICNKICEEKRKRAKQNEKQKEKTEKVKLRKRRD